MQKKNITKLLAALLGIIALIIIFLLISRLFSHDTKADVREGYKTILDVPGVQFEIKKDLSDYSTAVMEISKSVNFIDYQTYSYKNGQDTYLLFNIRNFIVIVTKGTDFNFATNGVTESLSKHSINGIWFSESGKDAVKTSSSSRYEVQVDAQVVITNAIYNDFCGTLTTLQKDGEEWTMFAGCVKGTSKEYEDIMSYISETFCFCEDNQFIAGAYTVDEEGHFEAVPEEQEPIQVVEKPEVDSNPTVTPSDEKIPVITAAPEVPTETPVPTRVPEATKSPETTKAPEVTEAPAVTNTPVPTRTPEATKTPSSSLPVLETDNGTFTLKGNQKNIKKEKDKVYTSSIYNMLSLNDTGYISIMGDETGGFQEAYVKEVKVYDAEETEKLIQTHIDSGNSYYTGMEAPTGTHFEAVQYQVNFLDEPATYVNISMCGLDGEDLRYRGIIYSHMTYDINENISDDGDWVTGYVAFYAVPNGCDEYVIKIGDAKPDDIAYFATYYRISR